MPGVRQRRRPPRATGLPGLLRALRADGTRPLRGPHGRGGPHGRRGAHRLGETAQPADARPEPDASPEPDARPEPEPHPDHTRVIGRLANTEAGSARTRRDGPSRALRLSFPGGQVVEVEPGRQVRLGRERRLCPAVGFLAAHDNLSRLHATVRVEPDGSASLTDEGSTNGTYLHGYRLPPHEPAVLNPGDAIRLAADVTVRVLA